MIKYLKYAGLLYPVSLLVAVAHFGYDLSNWYAAYLLCILAFCSPLILNLIAFKENE